MMQFDHLPSPTHLNEAHSWIIAVRFGCQSARARRLSCSILRHFYDFCILLLVTAPLYVVLRDLIAKVEFCDSIWPSWQYCLMLYCIRVRSMYAAHANDSLDSLSIYLTFLTILLNALLHQDVCRIRMTVLTVCCARALSMWCCYLTYVTVSLVVPLPQGLVNVSRAVFLFVLNNGIENIVDRLIWVCFLIFLQTHSNKNGRNMLINSGFRVWPRLIFEFQ